MNEPIQHLVLAPGEEPEVRRGVLGYSDITAIVGYPIEVVNLIRFDGATMYRGEDAKSEGQPDNPAATRLAHDALSDGDRVAGTVLIVGPAAAGGKETGLPERTLQAMLKEVTS